MRPRQNLFARIAAPAAFLLVATIAVLIIRAAVADDEPAGAPVAATTARATTAPARTTPPRRRARPQPPRPTTEIYVIESGDTLGTIAAAHETSVERLLELNPNLDPVTLSVGQRIRVPAG